MTDDTRRQLAANRPDTPGTAASGPLDPDQRATVTVYLRRRAELPATGRLGRAELASRHGADPADVDALSNWAEGLGLEVTEVHLGRRAVGIAGRLGDLAEAFGAELRRVDDADGRTHRVLDAPLRLPAGLGAAVTGVFGFDTRPQAGPRLRRAGAGGPTATSTSYNPPQVGAAYLFPADADGSGECIGLVELGGGYEQADLDSYFSGLGLGPPSVVSVSVDGGTNSPSTPAGPDSEVMLDLEVAGSLAPGARLAVYFAPNTDQGFIDAVSTAVHDTANSPSVVSISWGGPESTWSAAALAQMEDVLDEGATLGVTVTVAAGDEGSGDGVGDGLAHVDFPASAPHALGCGGTTLLLGPSGSVASEVVWDDLQSGGGATGGGVSAVFPVPAWQADAGVPDSANPGGGPGRGVPDVAGDADPDTGYLILVDGTEEVVGGTSAVAPLWAALVARLNQSLGTPVGFLNPLLYAVALPPPSSGGAFLEITSGTNGAYQAGPGWNPCTGLGSPWGQTLLDALRASAPPAGT